MSQYIVGLTGGIGSGKTTVTNLFAALDVDIVDADVVAREVVAPDSFALNEIQNHFGSSFILPDGNLDRAKLRTQVFKNSEDKDWLNNLLHPLIRKSMLEQLHACQSEYCILVAPLLIENHLDKLVDTVVVVDIDEQAQVERVLKRDSSSEREIRNIIASQVSRQERISAADHIINNQFTDLAKVKQQVESLHQLFLSEAKKSKE